MDADSLTAALAGRWDEQKRHGMARCPAHADRTPSLSISEQDGKTLVKCFAGCPQESVIAALRALELWTDAGPQLVAPSRNGQHDDWAEAVFQSAVGSAVAAMYDYHDEQGRLLFQVVRRQPKGFHQRHQGPGGTWVNNLDGVRRVLYRLPALLAADAAKPVYIVEGEKDADRLAGLGLVATTNPQGAGKWLPEYDEPLRQRHVVLLPDNDEPGRAHADAVANRLVRVAASVRIVTLPGVAEKGDVSDWLDAGGHLPALEELVAATPRLGRWDKARYPLQTLADLVQEFERDAQQLVEGILWADRITWAFAKPGVGKSLFLLAAGLHLAAGRPFHGRAVSPGPVLLLEEDSPLSVLAEYVQTLAEIYELDLDALPFWTNHKQGLRILDAEGLALAQEAVLSCPVPPRLVIVDSCERVVPSDKFSTRELDPFARFLQWLLSEGATPVVIDHVRREPVVKQGKADLMELLYGARAKSAMADVMLHFDGDLRHGVRVTYAKFRGELPSPFDLTFLPDEGFAMTDQPGKVQSPTEQKIMAWINRAGLGPHPKGAVLDGAGVPERSGERALANLVRRRWLVRSGVSRQGVTIEINPKIAVLFR